MQKIPSTLLSYNIFINENVTSRNKPCRPHRENIYRRWYSTYLPPRCSKERYSRSTDSGSLDLFNLSPDHDFVENVREDEQNDSI